MPFSLSILSPRNLDNGGAHHSLPPSHDAAARVRGASGVSANADWMSVTLLQQDYVGKLEVFDRISETKMPVSLVRDASVVNLGSLIGE